jgi:outer membrane immunogenic protein
MRRSWLLGSVSAFALLASSISVNAADQAVKAPIRAVAPAYNWAGWYVGLHMGGGSSENDSSFFRLTGGAPPHPTQSADSEAFVFGGGQVGYNWVVGQTLFGIEADISVGSGENIGLREGPMTFAVNRDGHWFGTVRGRWGWLWMPQYLVYVTGGVAFGQDDFDAVATGPGPLSPFAFSGSGTKVGWAAGGGLEWALDTRWSVKFEYQYLALGGDTETRFFCFTGCPTKGNRGMFSAAGSDDMHTGRLGLNYKFWGP